MTAVKVVMMIEGVSHTWHVFGDTGDRAVSQQTPQTHSSASTCCCTGAVCDGDAAGDGNPLTLEGL